MTNVDDGSGSDAGAMVIRALLVKGFATPDLLALAVLVPRSEVGAAVASLQAGGLVTESGGVLQLSDAGKQRGGEMIVEDRERWGVDNVVEALDAFIPIDQRLKKVVTAWQMRTIAGKQVLNDHTDDEYDFGVLDDFDEVHRRASRWLNPLHAGLPRLAQYSARLDHAADQVEEGNPAFIASPRVDSYHSVWFELHEDLILLAARTRSDEVAAGRA